MQLKQLLQYGVIGVLFLLPWQTRWIFGQMEVFGEPVSLGTLSIYATQVLIAVFVILYLVTQKERLHIQPRAWFASFIFIATAALASHNGIAYLHLIALFSVFLLVWILKSVGMNKQQFIQVIVLSLVLPVLLGLFQLIFGFSGASTWLGLAARDALTLGDSVFLIGGERILRAYGSFPHPNIFAGYLLIGLWGAWQLIQCGKKWAWGALGGFVVSLLATGSQAACLGALVMAAWVVFKPQQKHRWIAVIILAAISLGAVWVGVGDSFLERQQQYFALGDIMNFQFFTTGIGPMNYLFHWEFMQSGIDWWLYQPIHNVPLLMIAELGVIGFGAWFYYLAAPRMGFLVKGEHFPLVLAFIPPLLLDHYLWTTWAGLVIVALILSIDNLTKKSIDSREENH